jgi:hemerythrin-like domain-containing protein
MSRRHEQLLPLTHDHHHALRHARSLKLAGESGDPEALVQAVRTFLSFYEKELLTHFREEEEQLLPLVEPGDPTADELVGRTLREHVDLHRLIRRLRQGADPETALEVANLLRGHVRMEEDRLFPLIERSVSGTDLSGIRIAPRSRAAAADA